MSEKKIITLRIDEPLYQALRQYCEENFADQSTVIRTALAQWPPIRAKLEEMKNPPNEKSPG